MMMLMMLPNIPNTNHDHVLISVFLRVITTQMAGTWHFIVDQHFVMDTKKLCFWNHPDHHSELIRTIFYFTDSRFYCWYSKGRPT